MTSSVTVKVKRLPKKTGSKPYPTGQAEVAARSGRVGPVPVKLPVSNEAGPEVWNRERRGCEEHRSDKQKDDHEEVTRHATLLSQE